MASLDKYAAIADRFDMAESTACCAIRNLLRFIAAHMLPKLVTWPTAEERQEMRELYEASHGFPGVVGMIDGTHITIRMPAERGIDYYNRKEYYSVVLQVVVREDMRFTDVYAGWPGKVHDARVFRQSHISVSGPALCGDDHILGDSAYPNLPFLLTPFKDNGHLTPVQRKYNITHARIRSLVERAIGLLKNRLTRLKKIDQRDIETVVTTIMAGCVIHNVCILNDDEFVEALADEDDDIPQPQPNRLNFNQNAQVSGLQKRLDMVLPIQQKYCTFMTLEVVSQSDRHGRINKVTPGVLVRIKLRKKVNLLSRHSAAAGWGGGGLHKY